ncbi:Ig-like domain-containing protein, partial [Ligilactobacillus hayakitensis]|uniref:Ig-like domain-containing protein n=1 Tax=Ligilactobacillus hayakitensis TaxID=396716 RepID=UPI000B14DCB9
GNFTVEVPADKTADLVVTAQEPGKKASETVNTVDKTGLENSIAEGTKLSSDNQVTLENGTKVGIAPSDKAVLDEALNAGKDTDGDTTATQSDIDADKKAIDDAIKNILDKAKQATSIQAKNEGNKISGKAAAGAKVTITDKNGNVLGTAVADENGMFTVELPSADLANQELTVIAQEEGKQPVSTTIKNNVVDKDQLQAAVEKAPAVRASNMFAFASASAQKAYNDAVAAGQKVLNDENATQAQVDEA